MSQVLDFLDEQRRADFIDLVKRRDANLLQDLLHEQSPSRETRLAVVTILSNEFSSNLDNEYEPTLRGREIDALLGAFLERWPIEAAG